MSVPWTIAATKLDKLDKTNKFLEAYNLPKLKMKKQKIWLNP